MKLRSDLTINGVAYPKGTDVPWYSIYPFFMVHMLIFGASGFFLAYGVHSPSFFFLLMHGGIAISIYTVFYVLIFGMDEVKWMLINAALGAAGIYTQIDWILSLFHRRASDYPLYLHVIPSLYYVLYTFLLRHAVLDLTQSREDPVRKGRAEVTYVIASVAAYAAAYYMGW